MAERFDLEKAVKIVGLNIHAESADEGRDFDVACRMIISALEEIQQYRAIGTVEECRTAMERMKPKKAEYKKMVYPKHKWREYNGKVDNFAYEIGYCNGPVCERCYYSFCEDCHPEGWNGECVVEDYICSSCGEKVDLRAKFCDCGQAIDWGKE